MITIARDSDGTTFQIWKQDQDSSCTIASTWMARGIVRAQSFAEGEWELAVRAFRKVVSPSPGGIFTAAPQAPRTFDPRAFPSGDKGNQSTMGSTFSNFGLYDDQVLRVLRGEGLKVDVVNYPFSIDGSRIGGRKCALVLVRWQGGGGHAIVAARQASNGFIVYLDPWDGQINTQVNFPIYKPRYGGLGRIGVVHYLS